MIREVSYKVKVLRNGAPYSELRWSKDNPPQLTVNADGELKSSFAGTFDADSKINWLRDEIQPCIVINDEEQILGTLRIATKSGGEASFSQFARIEAYDKGWQVQTGKTESLLHLDAGTGYVNAIKALLLERDVVNVISDAAAQTLPAAREWPVGTSYLTIINTLLAEIAFNPLWFDAAGYAHLQAYAAPTAAAIQRRYSADDVRLSPMSRDYTEETDIFSAPNVFICICDNPDRSATLKATAENETWGSKSILARGLRIPTVIKVDQIADQASLQAYANKKRDESIMSERTVSFSVSAEGGRGVGDIIAVDHPSIGGIYRESGWSLRLAPGERIKISAKRTVIM